MYKKILLILFFFVLILSFIPKGYAGVYLDFDRNEYYETSEIAYNMEDMLNSTHLYDFALNDYHGEMDSGLQFTDGYFGQGITDFDNSNNITMGNPDISSGAAFTIMFWYYPTADGNIRSLFGYGAGKYIARWSSGVVYIISGLDGVFSNSIVPLNQWTHLAFVFDPANSSYLMQIYQNGTLDTGTVTSYRNRGWTETCYIGDGHYGYAIGIIDEFRFYKGEARTQAEIQTDMKTSMAMKLTVEDLEPNEAIVQLWYVNDTLFEQQTADSNGKVEYNVFSFSNKSSEYEGVMNVYTEDIQYFGYVSVLNWGDIYKFMVLSAYEDLFIQLFFGEGAWLGILLIILGAFVCLYFYKYSAVVFCAIFILLGLQYFTEFNAGSNDLLWFWVFCWSMPIFLVFAMIKKKR